MVRGYNRIILMGNLARDRDEVYASKQAVARLTVAVGRTWRITKEISRSILISSRSCLGNQAENCGNTCERVAVLVEGRLQIRNYETQGGDKRWVTEVVAQNVVFLGSSSRDSQDYSFKDIRNPLLLSEA